MNTPALAGRIAILSVFLMSCYAPNSWSITCAPSASAAPASMAEFLECLNSFQEYKKTEQLSLLELAADGLPSDLETRLDALLLRQDGIAAVVKYAFTSAIITRSQKSRFQSALKAEFKPLKALKTGLVAGQGQSAALRRFKATNVKDGVLDKLIDKTFRAEAPANAPPSVKISKGGGSGFRTPNQQACFLVQGCSSVTSAGITVNNPYSSINITPIQAGSVTVSDKPDSGKEICVTMGDSQGSGRLGISACGVTLNSPLLFNNGATAASGSSSSGLRRPPQLSGGSCTGSAAVTGLVAGNVNVQFSFSQGKVTATQPAAGTGTISQEGIRFTTAKGDLGSVKVGGGGLFRWHGTVWIPRTKSGDGASISVTAKGSSSMSSSLSTSRLSGEWETACAITNGS